MREGEERQLCSHEPGGQLGGGRISPSSLVSRETCLLGRWKQGLWLQLASKSKCWGTPRSQCAACLEGLSPSPGPSEVSPGGAPCLQTHLQPAAQLTWVGEEGIPPAPHTPCRGTLLSLAENKQIWSRFSPAPSSSS